MNFSKLNTVLISQFDFQIGEKIVWSQSQQFLLGLGIFQFESNNYYKNATLFFAFRNARNKIIKKLCLKRACQFTMIREGELLNLSLPWCFQPKIQQKLLDFLKSQPLQTNMKQEFLKLGDLLFQKYKDSQIKIKDHFRLVRGKTPPTKNPEYYQNGTIKWINSGVLTNLYFLTDKTPASKLVTEKAVQECRLSCAQPNTVLFSNVETNPQAIAWVKKEVNYLLGNHVWTLLSKDIYNNCTLLFALRQINFSLYHRGSVIQELYGSDLMNMKINWVSNPQKQKIFYNILNYV